MKQILYENDVIPYGKYEGQIIKYVLQKDPRYLLWFQDTSRAYCFAKELQNKVLARAVQ